MYLIILYKGRKSTLNQVELSTLLTKTRRSQDWGQRPAFLSSHVSTRLSAMVDAKKVLSRCLSIVGIVFDPKVEKDVGVITWYEYCTPNLKSTHREPSH
jgi:hypothetical protein